MPACTEAGASAVSTGGWLGGGAWWVTTILEGEPSKEISGTPGIIVLYDDIHQERAFGHGIVLAPQYKGYSGVAYTNVTIQIDALY